jgi:hypothetical protein
MSEPWAVGSAVAESRDHAWQILAFYEASLQQRPDMPCHKGAIIPWLVASAAAPLAFVVAIVVAIGAVCPNLLCPRLPPNRLAPCSVQLDDPCQLLDAAAHAEPHGIVATIMRRFVVDAQLGSEHSIDSFDGRSPWAIAHY